MSLHNYKRPAFTVVSAGMLLIPSMLLCATTITKPIDVHARGVNCNVLAKTITEAVCMQDMNDEVKESMVLERQYELRDARDGKMYYIAKLADGNVWMTQNLDFDLDESVTLTPDDTDVKNRWTPNGSTVWYDDFVDEYYGGGGGGETEKNASELSESPADGDLVQYSVDVGDLYWNGDTYVVLQSTDDVTEAVPEYEIENTLASGDRHYHLGNYYNWLAAVASNEGEEFTDEDGSADQSICPAGWTLPELGYSTRKGGEESRSGNNVPSFSELAMNYVTYNEEYEEMMWSILPYESPVFFNYSGYNMRRVGYSGTLWSRNYMALQFDEPGPGPSTKALAQRSPLMGYAAFYNDEYVDIASASASERLYSVRCVARSRAAIVANWVQGQEHEVESEEEGVLKVEAPEEDGEIVDVMLDDMMVSGDSGIVIEEDENNGGFLITFPSEYLDELDEGDHIVRAVFSSGRSAYAVLTVSRSGSVVPHTGVPDTGEFTNEKMFASEEGKLYSATLASIMIGVASAVVFAPIIRRKTKRL